LFANGRKQLFSLSSSIGYLAALEELDVGCCALRSVPPEIGQCGVLRKLHLRGNSIEELPSEVNALTALEELDVARNPLSTLLPHMDTLINLRLLVLNETNLSQAAVDEIMQLAPPGCLIYWATSWRQSR
jgi:Leucine-rich repeat (LRR) protein